MATIVLKNVPEKLRRRLKSEAERNRRSMSQHALTILEHHLHDNPIPPLPDPLRPLRPVSRRLILKGIREGRM